MLFDTNSKLLFFSDERKYSLYKLIAVFVVEQMPAVDFRYALIREFKQLIMLRAYGMILCFGHPEGPERG